MDILPKHYAVTTDIVVFTIRDDALHVLLVERAYAPFKGEWALPGGFLLPKEDLDTCAKRELDEETGASGFYLEQLYTFGDVERDPRERVLTVAYFALVPSAQIQLRPGTDSAKAAWFPMKALPKLAFDHGRIITVAHERLSAKLEYTTIAFQLLPERFTIRDVHSIYEAVLGKLIDRRNFYKKMLASGDLTATRERRIEGAHRPATVYRLRRPADVRVTK